MASNTALIHELQQRDKEQDAMAFVISMFYDAYFTLNRKDWLDVVNKEFRDRTERRFKMYSNEFRTIYDNAPEQFKQMIYQGQKTRFFNEGVFDEVMTLKQWLAHIDDEVEIDPMEEFPPCGEPIKLKKKPKKATKKKASKK